MYIFQELHSSFMPAVLLCPWKYEHMRVFMFFWNYLQWNHSSRGQSIPVFIGTFYGRLIQVRMARTEQQNKKIFLMGSEKEAFADKISQWKKRVQGNFILCYSLMKNYESWCTIVGIGFQSDLQKLLIADADVNIRLMDKTSSKALSSLIFNQNHIIS